MSDEEHQNLPDDADVSETNVNDSATVTTVQFIPRKYVPKHKITVQHATDCIFPGENVSPEEKLTSLNELKLKAKHWFRNEIGKIFTNEIQNANLYFKKVIQNEVCNFKVRNIDEFLLKVEQDGTDDFMEVIFNVCYKYFDIKLNWPKELEDKFMKEYNFQYADGQESSHSGRNKGCFEILAAAEKTEMVKRIQRTGKKAHGKYLTIELPRRPDGKYQKRRAGFFYKEFIKNDSTKVEIKNSRFMARAEVSYKLVLFYIYFFLCLSISINFLA